MHFSKNYSVILSSLLPSKKLSNILLTIPGVKIDKGLTL